MTVAKINRKASGFDVFVGCHVWIGQKDDPHPIIAKVLHVTPTQFDAASLYGGSTKRYWKSGRPLTSFVSVTGLATESEVTEHVARKAQERERIETAKAAQEEHRNHLERLSAYFNGKASVKDDEYAYGKLMVTFSELSEVEVAGLAALVQGWTKDKG